MRGPAVNHALASDLNWPSEAAQPLKAGGRRGADTEAAAEGRWAMT